MPQKETRTAGCHTRSPRFASFSTPTSQRFAVAARRRRLARTQELFQATLPISRSLRSSASRSILSLVRSQYGVGVSFAVCKMIGSFLTRGLVMVLGYAYPAYECYKTVEKNKPEIEQLLFWCQYWILVAVLTVCERIGDAFISWVPMYSEAKLAFFIYLWYPKTKGTTYVYDSFFKPYVAKHENEIDRNLLELRTRAGDMAVLYWQRAASYSQSRVFEILQYVAAQSTPKPRLAQAQQQGSRAHQPPTPKCQPSAASNHQPAATQPESEESSSPASSSSSRQNPLGVAEEVVPSSVSEADLPPVALNAPEANVTSETSGQSTRNEAEVMQVEVAPSSSANENVNPLPKETVIKETTRVTRTRSKKTQAGGNQKNA